MISTLSNAHESELAKLKNGFTKKVIKLFIKPDLVGDTYYINSIGFLGSSNPSGTQ